VTAVAVIAGLAVFWVSSLSFARWTVRHFTEPLRTPEEERLLADRKRVESEARSPMLAHKQFAEQRIREIDARLREIEANRRHGRVDPRRGETP
jgi:hypothetical protein